MNSQEQVGVTCNWRETKIDPKVKLQVKTMDDNQHLVYFCDEDCKEEWIEFMESDFLI